MKCLISAEPADSQAVFIKLALESMGHEIKMLFPELYSLNTSHSVFISRQEYEWKHVDKDHCSRNENYDVIWWRLPYDFRQQKDFAISEKYRFAIHENLLFQESLIDINSPEAGWINNREASIKAASLACQLKRAKNVGFPIPKTLFSNLPSDIRYFVLKHENEGVIYKPCIPGSHAQNICFIDLPDNASLKTVPGIYQVQVQTKQAVKVIYMGGHMMAVSLSNKHGLSVEPCILPSDIENRIRALMTGMGLVFASVSLCVNRSGEWIFLNLDDQSEFLWIEQHCPEVKVLDAMVQFILSGGKEFKYAPEKAWHSLEDYAGSADECVSLNRMRYGG